MSNIIVIAEVRGGSLKRPSLEAITAAKQLATASGGQVLAIACGNGIDAAAAELAAGGATKVIAIDGASFAEYSGDAWAKAIAAQVQANDGAAVLMAHTAMGKDLLPRVSGLLDTGIITDVVEVSCEGGSYGAKKLASPDGTPPTAVDNVVDPGVETAIERVGPYRRTCCPCHRFRYTGS